MATTGVVRRVPDAVAIVSRPFLPTRMYYICMEEFRVLQNFVQIVICLIKPVSLSGTLRLRFSLLVVIISKFLMCWMYLSYMSVIVHFLFITLIIKILIIMADECGKGRRKKTLTHKARASLEASDESQAGTTKKQSAASSSKKSSKNAVAKSKKSDTRNKPALLSLGYEKGMLLLYLTNTMQLSLKILCIRLVWDTHRRQETQAPQQQ